MSRGEEGDFELILGHKQLLAVFFILVFLLGVFFVMGYVVGRSLNPALTQDKQAMQPAETQEAPPLIVTGEGVSEPAHAEALREPGRAALIPPPEAVKTPPPQTAQPSAAAMETAPPKREPPPPAPPAPEVASGEPRPGQTYIQVSAVKPEDAELLVSALKRSGLPAQHAASPKPELRRVLVGPYSDGAAISKAKEDLAKLGFTKTFVQTYR